MRNLKALGLALVAVFAMSFVVAATASADVLTAEVGTVNGIGDQDGGTDIFTTTSGTVSCTSATYSGTVTSGSKEAVAAPVYSGCTAFGFPAIVDVNGCKYRFTQTAPEAAPTTTKIDLECPAGQELTVTVNENAANTLTTKCIIHVPSQKEVGHIIWTNIGTGTTRELTGHISVHTLTYRHTAGTGIGACTGGEASNGTYVGKVRVTATNPATGLHVGIFLS